MTTPNKPLRPGDRVRVVSCSNDRYIGSEGVIAGMDCLVRFDRSSAWHKAEDLQQIDGPAEAAQPDPNRGAVRSPFCALRSEPHGRQYLIKPTAEYDYADTPIAHVFSDRGMEIAEAFATLFAAAPDLLEFVYRQWLSVVGEQADPSYIEGSVPLIGECEALWEQATGGSIMSYHIARWVFIDLTHITPLW